MLAVGAAQPEISDTVATSATVVPAPEIGVYGLGDQILMGSNYTYLPYDDWGVKGALQVFGLPSTALKISIGGLQMCDPVYGQTPLTWFNPRFDRFILGLVGVKIIPRFVSSQKVTSRFDYYRGDYGYKNFSLLLGGRMVDTTVVWRFIGENLGYDSYYGILGAKTALTGESISQIYRLDLQTVRGNWQLNFNGAYYKYLPGFIQTSPSSTSIYLLPFLEGNVKEYMACIGGSAAKSTVTDTTFIGLQQTNFVYGQFVEDTDFSFKGVAGQTEMAFYYAKYFGRWRLALIGNPLTRSVSLRNGFYLRQNQIAGGIGLSATRAKRDWKIILGANGSHFDGEMSLRYEMNPVSRLGVQLLSSYALYPMIYKMNFAANQPITADGFEYAVASVDFGYSGRFIKLGLALSQVNSDFYTPYKSVIDDTTITYKRQKLDAVYLTANASLILPWRMRLTVRSLLSDNEDGVWLQGWGQIRQELDLFRGNLKLYAAGEMTYWDSNSRLAWFEELRGVGVVGADYFTNNRLNLAVRIGGNIGDFHIFYAIYNAEGRAFSTISGMNYRNRLKIFGVEWQFLD